MILCLTIGIFLFNQNVISINVKDVTYKIEVKDIKKQIQNSYHRYWIRRFGGEKEDGIDFLIKTYDNYFVAAGETYSYGAGDFDVAVFKFDNIGNIIWGKSIGGTGKDWAYSLIETSDHYYILSGYTSSFGAGSNDGLVIKLDSNGDLKWAKTYGGSGNDIYYANIELDDGSILLAGSTYSKGTSGDFWITKINSFDGSIVWNKHFGGNSSDIIRSVDKFPNGFVLAGYSASFGAGSDDIFVASFSNSGVINWAKTYGGNNRELSRYGSIKKTDPSGFIVTGYSSTYSNGAKLDGLILKIDQSGDKVWFKRYYNDYGLWFMPISELSNGNFLVGGSYIPLESSKRDYLICLLNSEGENIKSVTYRGEGLDEIYSNVVSYDGYYFAGDIQLNSDDLDDINILKFDFNLNIPGSDCNGLEEVTLNYEDTDLTINSPSLNLYDWNDIQVNSQTLQVNSFIAKEYLCQSYIDLSLIKTVDKENPN
ncbi:MAG: hypothetical protein H5U37_04620, partial [Caldisericia bacterium]|nr:hypothetical protein [Caldisericia bacterium]